jgi:hypothetical protein
MTTPINLTQLRERAEALAADYPNPNEEPPPLATSVPTMLALIDTAEAAIESIAMSHSCDQCETELPHTYRLRETLNRYTDVVRPPK